MRIRALVVVALLAALAAGRAGANTVSVRFAEGAHHVFLVLRAASGGQVLAHGQTVQTPRGNRMESRLTFRFTDGSLYDETVTFAQQRVFRLLAYKMIQRGRSFPESSEVEFDRAQRRYKARVGEDTSDGTLDEMPDDLQNGLLSTLLRNLPPGGGGHGHLLVFTPKPRLLKSEVRPEGEERFTLGDVSGSAVRYLVKLEITGLTGKVATLVGKEPPDVHFWITSGPAPTFVKFEGALFLKGPRWRVEMAAPRWAGDR